MSSGADDVRKAIINDGFWLVEDKSIGITLDQLVASGFHIQTLAGMGLCKAAVFNNKLLRDTTRTFFQRPTLGFYRKFGKTKNIHCVMPKTQDLRILLVFVWSSHSRMLLYPRSHLQDLGAVGASNGLFKLADQTGEAGVVRGLQPSEVMMEHGGFAILDARSWWKIDGGTFVMFGIMSLEESEHWVQMPLPITLSGAVSEMTDEDMTMNVTYFDPDTAGTDNSLDS